jgi:transcriptional regulator with XRE-family HTH domain
MSERQWTQEKMARECSISKSALEKYLAGSNPSLDAVRSICKTCHVSADWLLFGGDRKHELPVPIMMSIMLDMGSDTIRSVATHLRDRDDMKAALAEIERRSTPFVYPIASKAVAKYLDYSSGDVQFGFGPAVPIPGSDG